MNLLFLSDFEISPNAGGIERVVHCLSEMFEARGIWCFSAYCRHKGVGNPTVFRNTVCLDACKTCAATVLRQMIEENDINVVMSVLLQKQNFSLMPKLYAATRDSGGKVVYVYHTMPGYELQQTIGLKLAWYKLRHGMVIKNILPMLALSVLDVLGLKRLMYPVVRRKLEYGLYADTVCLLSERYIPEYKRFVGKTDIPFIAIADPLPYLVDEKFDVGRKEKMVLSVGRFDMMAKRQDLLLDIWADVEKNQSSADWRLVLVGYGDEEEYLKRHAEKLGLKRVTFAGFCDPREYYRKAAIYALTSAYEGFGMVLIEAQQYGVVPVAFDSYASVHDIVEDGRNGFLVPEKDKTKYADRLLTLMDNAEVRNAMAEVGLTVCEKFGKEKIADCWMVVLNSLCDSVE